MVSVQNKSITQNTKRASLLEAVEALGPLLRAHATENEELGTLARPVVDGLRDAGMFRMKLTEELGGAEADPMLQMEVLEGLAYHDLTAAWCTMVGATGVSVLGSFLPEEGIARIFGNNEIPLASVMPVPSAKAVPEKGGYRISGRWYFNSGVRHAEWSAVAARVTETESADGDAPKIIIMGLPTKDATIHDSWDVVALQGTGSCDMSVDDYFIPAELTSPFDMMAPAPRRGGPLYTLPFFAYVGNEHASVVVGAAKRALDELIHIAQTTRGKLRASKLEERQVVQRFIGEASLKIDAARALMYNRYEIYWQKICDGGVSSPQDLAELRAIGTYCTDVAVEIATQTFRYGGGKALYRPNIFERLLRDVNAAGQHIAVSDQAYEDYGRSLLA